MKTFKKILKFTSIFLILLFAGIIGYVYSLTFTSQGRLDWGQALTLRLFKPNVGIEDIKKMNVEQRRQLLSGIPINGKVASIDSLKITSDSLQIFIFKPKNLPPNSPIIVDFHGGGFTTPWSNLSQNYALNYANKFNKIVVGVDYRVAPENPFPIPQNDCYATLKWVIENAKKIGGNANEIIVIGESSGGTLAAAVAQRAKMEGLSNIKFLILDCPSVDLPFKYESFKKYSTGYFLEKSDIEFAYASYLPNPKDCSNPYALPIFDKNLTGLPPTYIITAEFDPLKDQAIAYLEELKKANVKTYYKELKGMLHVMPGPFNEKERDKMYFEVAEAMKKHVK